MLSTWLHFTALAVYLSALIGIGWVLFKAVSVVNSDRTQISLLVRSLKIYNPVQTGALGLLILSGAFQLTDLKAAYRENFIKELGGMLELKLFFAFILIMLSTFQSMGVAHRFVKRCEGGEACTTGDVRSVVRRLRISTLCILGCAAITFWFALHLRS
ncbi:MAG: hypothetical protein HY695_07600 [Deltaproteobacteria bacterium]|nr:hypothetical protein [Deltaproteobacteria bacterium]